MIEQNSSLKTKKGKSKKAIKIVVSNLQEQQVPNIEVVAQRRQLIFCIAAYNAAENLPRCVASIKPYADRIIVVEGLFADHWRGGADYSAPHSTDETVQVAKTLGCEVVIGGGLVQHKQRDLYLVGREGDVYFLIDADMTLEGSLDKEEILNGGGNVWSVWVHGVDGSRQVSPIWVSRHIGEKPCHGVGNIRFDGFGKLMDGTYPGHRVLETCFLRHYRES